MSLFGLNQYHTDYLTEQIMMNSWKEKEDSTSDAVFDHSIYEHGFRYYCFENDTMHDMQSKIMMYSFQNTPEKLLLQLCKKAKVIGISATATVPSVIGNFDLEYLRSNLQSRFYTLPSSEYARLKQEFLELQTGYQDKIKIHAKLFSTQGEVLDIWKRIVDDDELAQAIDDGLKKSGCGEYYEKRYARIAMAFKEFLLHDEIQSMLCLLTAHPKQNDRNLNLHLLLQIFAIAGHCFHKDFEKLKMPEATDLAENYVVVLKSENFDEEKEILLQRLAEGEKLFVISTYQTIGAGQNLQYPIPDAIHSKLICSDSRKPRNEKDFDAVYLDKPTNLVVNMEKNWKEENFVKYLFQAEFMQENAELSMSDTLQHIRKAFKCYITGEKVQDYVPSVYDKKSIMLYSARVIIQAVGRICRTNQKNENIYLFADEAVADSIDLSVTKGRILNHEFLTLAECIREKQKKVPVSGSLEDKATLISSRVIRDIDTMLNGTWTFAQMQKWKQLRETVLRHPTVSSEEAEKNIIFMHYYVRLPQKSDKVYYSQTEDYHHCEIAFSPTQTAHSVEDAVNTRLDRLMQWKALREYFTVQGYATAFEENDYIMSPPLWNNIYKGALGEAAGWFWFSHVLGIQLEELNSPEEFELFDYKISGKPVYVDFKNWSESTAMSWEETIRKIELKAQQCGCRCAVIANILTYENYQIQKFTQNGIDFLILPSLLNDKNQAISINQDALETVRRYIHEYSD